MSENDANNLKLREITFQGLKVNLPDCYPVDIVNFQPDNFRSIFIKSLGSNKSYFVDDLISQDSIFKLINTVQELYPKLDYFDEKDELLIRRFFPSLKTKEEILSNWQTIADYFEKLIAYDVAIKMPKLVGGIQTKSAMDYSGYNVSSCEKWYLISNSRMVDGVKKATSLALQYELIITGATVNNGGGRGDAIRHAIWNVYIGKYACHSYGTIDKAAEKIEGFTTAHECDSPEDADKQMDLHNNAVGITYFKAHAERIKVSCFLGICNYNVDFEVSDMQVATDVGSMPILFTPESSMITPVNLYTLVKIVN